MTEILNERGRARAGGPERAAQACLQPNAIGENAGENACEPQVRRAHSVRAGERVVRTQDLMTQRAALRHHSARGRA
jgi:hypothetical protein